MTKPRHPPRRGPRDIAQRLRAARRMIDPESLVSTILLCAAEDLERLAEALEPVAPNETQDEVQR